MWDLLSVVFHPTAGWIYWIVVASRDQKIQSCVSCFPRYLIGCDSVFDVKPISDPLSIWVSPTKEFFFLHLVSVKRSQYKRPVEAYPLRGSCVQISFHFFSPLELPKHARELRRPQPGWTHEPRLQRPAVGVIQRSSEGLCSSCVCEFIAVTFWQVCHFVGQKPETERNGSRVDWGAAYDQLTDELSQLITECKSLRIKHNVFWLLNQSVIVLSNNRVFMYLVH